MAEHMTFVLDGRDNLSPVINRAADSADRFDNRVSGAMANSNRSVQRFTQDANGRLHDLRGRFLSTAQAARVMAGDTRGLSPALRNVTTSSGQAAGALGTGGGGLGGVMGVVAAVLGLSLLPALGAVVPMMAGAAVAAGTLKLGFRGVGEAVALASEDKKEYAKALAKLPAPAREFTKALVGLKGQFTGLAPQIQKAMLPGFTKAVKAAGPVVDLLGKSMTSMAGGFGDAASGAARLMKDSGFQKDFGQTLKLGNGFVKELTSSMGPFVRSLLDFGAASGPTLKSFSSGISGLLGKGGGGLAGFFDGLQAGVGGASALLDGLFGAVNRILPAFGRLSGSAAAAFGPLLGELLDFSGKATSALLDGLGGAVRWLSPVFHDLAFGVKAVTTVLGLIAPTVRDTAGAIFGSFMPAFSEVDKARGPLQRLSDTITENKGSIQEFARTFGSGVIDIAGAVISNLPGMLGIFRMVTGGMVSAMGGVLHAAASAFGWIPGVGDKLRRADESFGRFKDSYLSGLAAAEQKTREFAEGALPKLEQGRLKMNISNWTSQIATAKGQLKTVPPNKRADLLARISDLQAKVRQANRELASVRDKTVTLTTQRHYINITENRTIYSGQGGRGPNAATGGLYTGRGFRTKYGTGGLVDGPGTGTSDSVAAPWLSAGEFVVKAKSVGKYGLEMLRAINDGRFGIGSMTGAGQEAGRGLSAGLTGAVGGVGAAARRMAAAVTAGVRAELEIASPSKKMKALMADVGKGLIVGLTGTRAQIRATALDLAKDIWTAWSGTRSTKDSQLVAMVYRENSRLQKLASQRDALAARIAAAKTYAGEVTGAARQGAELGNLGVGEVVTAGGIKAAMASKIGRIRRFTGFIKKLAARGLHKTLLRQILAMGPEEGYAYAAALAEADNATLSSVSRAQHGLDSATRILGETGADGLYDSGKNAAKGFLSGLQSQRKQIVDLMWDIARSMQAAIRKALGIRSPSTVLARIGRQSAEGLALGLKSGVPGVAKAMGEVSSTVAIGVRPAYQAAVAPSARGGRPLEIHIHVDGTVLDPVAVGRQIQTALLELKRAKGGAELGLA